MKRAIAAQKLKQEQAASQVEFGEVSSSVGTTTENSNENQIIAQPAADLQTQPPALKVNSLWSSASVLKSKSEDQPLPTKLRRF